MINLGPYSGKNCPNVRFQPTVLDRILEAYGPAYRARYVN